MAERMDKVQKFRFWCQKVLPAVYDDSLSYYELLNKVVKHLNSTIEVVNEAVEGIDDAIQDASDAKSVADDAKSVADDAKDVAQDAKDLVDSVVYDPGDITEDITLNTDSTKVVISNAKFTRQGNVVWFCMEITPKAVTSTMALAVAQNLPPRIDKNGAFNAIYKGYNRDDLSDQINCALDYDTVTRKSNVYCRFASGNVDEVYMVSGCYMCG